MGGAYKPLVPFRGRPLVAWSLDALAPLVGETLVACGAASNAARLAPVLPAGTRVVPDVGEGPLGGLVEAARVARGARLLVAPADSPFLTTDAYRRLLVAAEGAEGAEGALYVVDGVGQPLTCVLSREAFLRAAEGAGSVKAAQARMGLARVDGDAWRAALRDLDTPADLRDA